MNVGVLSTDLFALIFYRISAAHECSSLVFSYLQKIVLMLCRLHDSCRSFFSECKFRYHK